MVYPAKIAEQFLKGMVMAAGLAAISKEMRDVFMEQTRGIQSAILKKHVCIVR